MECVVYRLAGGIRWLLALGALAAVLVVAGCTDGAPSLQISDEEATVEQTAASINKGTGEHGKNTGNLKVVRDLPPPPETRGGTLQLISPNDLLEITFFGVDKLNREVRVDSTGHISMPLVGSVQAAGKTVRQLERELESLYGRSYLQNPQITVNVKESMGQRVTVNGQVRKPGLYPVVAGSTLMQVIAQAQGFTPIGDPSKVFVFRKIGQQRYVAQYDVEAISEGKKADPRIYGGDIVVVFPSSAKVALENLKAVLGVATQAGTLAVMPLP